MIKATGEEMMNNARETGEKNFDLSEIKDGQLFILEDALHGEMVEGFILSAEELNFVLGLSLLTYLMPIGILNKWVFSRINHTYYKFTLAELLDFTIVGIVTMLWVVVVDFETSDLKYPLFNKEEDSQLEIKFIGNIAFNIIDDSFHFDYLLAAATAVLWLRCVLLLRLTELFGPTIVMIGKMLVIILKFLVIYILGLLTFSSVATLTLSESQNFRDLF